MANWYGIARTNYVKVKDVDALTKFLDGFSVEIHKHPTMPGYVMFSPGEMSDYGGFSYQAYDEDDNEIEFDWANDIASHLCEGQILIVHEVGWEKLRYLTGHAIAVTWDGRETFLNIDDIYEKAREVFNLPSHPIATATYQDTVA